MRDYTFKEFVELVLGKSVPDWYLHLWEQREQAKDMKQTIVLVTGSRGWTDYPAIYYTFARAKTVIGPFALLHGGARGVDTYAAVACRVQRIRVLDAVLPDWRPTRDKGKVDYGAGKSRNLKMLDRKPDYVFGFWDGRSRGTIHCLEAAIARRIPVFLLTSQTNTPDLESRVLVGEGRSEAGLADSLTA